MSPKLEQRRRQSKPQEQEPAAVEATVDAEAERLKAEGDKLLAEIDEVLDDIIGEGSAQTFVDSYQQKGGE